MDLLERLKHLSIDEMIELRNAIDAGLKERIAAERKNLQSKLSQLENVESGSGQKRGVAKGTKVAPKYRGPGGETWAGRGARPKWLSQLTKKGRKVEEFLIK